MSKLNDLLKELCPCLPAGRPIVLSEKDLPQDTNFWYTYVILCENGSLYKGFTNNLKERFKMHSNGLGAQHTKKYKPLGIVYFEKFDNQQDAIIREKYFKSGSGREWLKNKLFKDNK